MHVFTRETRLSFTETSPGSEADIGIFFHRAFHGDGYPFDGSGSVLAHAFFPGSGRGGDIHMDEDENWTEERIVNREKTSVFAVAVHEFGHSLGLSHSSVEGSLMYPWYSGLPRDGRLPRDDLEAVQHLYGAKEIDDDGAWDEEYFLRDPSSDGPDHHPSSTAIPSSEVEDSLPDKCETSFDAVAVIRSEMWVFKGNYFWRIDKSGSSREDPIALSAFWYGLPVDVEHVDAVYERDDHRIVFFVGEVYYVLAGNSILEQGPVPISRLGLPPTVKKIDGAMKWGWNDKTYFFSGKISFLKCFRNIMCSNVRNTAHDSSCESNLSMLTFSKKSLCRDLSLLGLQLSFFSCAHTSEEGFC